MNDINYQNSIENKLIVKIYKICGIYVFLIVLENLIYKQKKNLI